MDGVSDGFCAELLSDIRGMMLFQFAEELILWSTGNSIS